MAIQSRLRRIDEMSLFALCGDVRHTNSFGPLRKCLRGRSDIVIDLSGLSVGSPESIGQSNDQTDGVNLRAGGRFRRETLACTVSLKKPTYI